jgi:ubiquinone/menaquinone biosynthesis C-methylase UbiE
VRELSSDPKLIPYVLPILEGTTLLDIGCGHGKWGYLLKVDFWYTKSGRRKATLQYTIGADLHIQYLKFVKNHRIYDDVVLSDAKYLPFGSEVFETILFLEVIEHMVKKEGILSLREAERVAKSLVVVSTPAFYWKQDARDKNVFQRHLSKWTIKDFKRLGYTVIFGSFPIERIYNYLQHFLIKLTYILPQYPVSILAVKHQKLPTKGSQVEDS